MRRSCPVCKSNSHPCPRLACCLGEVKAAALVLGAWVALEYKVKSLSKRWVCEHDFAFLVSPSSLVV